VADASRQAASRQADRTHPTRAQLRAQFAEWHPAAVVAVTVERSALGRYLISLLGPPTAGAGGVLGWRLLPG